MDSLLAKTASHCRDADVLLDGLAQLDLDRGISQTNG